MTKNIGILPLGRATFDVPYAEEKLAAMLAQLDATGFHLSGPRELLFDTESTLAAMQQLEQANIDSLLVLQVTFTDAAMITLAASRFALPLLIWAVPEPRLGGRLRLNAFCGLNLASHALDLNQSDFAWLYCDANEHCQADLRALLDGGRRKQAKAAVSSAAYSTERGQEIANSLAGKRIACIGEHPDGFATCQYDRVNARELTGIEVEKIELNSLFAQAKQVDSESVVAVSALAHSKLDKLDQVDQSQLDRSFRLKAALDIIRAEGSYDAFAIRCWPETFTEYGGAVCGPVSMLGEARVPCACEADVYGAMTQLLLQQVANASVFLVDMVDIDIEDNTGVVWHCGQAPVSMADPDVVPVATIHTNRKMPLLYEFPLKPGQVTLARISQAGGEPRLVIMQAEVLKRPMAFTGTSGVLRFDGGAENALNTIMDCGLEHHLGLVYGDHVESLRSVAAALNLPLIETSQPVQ